MGVSEKKVKTFGIKLSELHPCDNCGKELVPFFQHMQVRMAVFNKRNVDATLGTAQILGGVMRPGVLAIAEALAPGADDAVEVIDEPDATTTLFICGKCFMEPLDMAVLVAKSSDAKEKKLGLQSGS